MKYLYPFLVIISTSIVTACTKTSGNPGTNGNDNNNPVSTTIYIGATSGNTYAIDEATGTQKWMFPSGGGAIQPRAFVAYSKGTVYVSNEHSLYAVDARTGNQKWKFDTHSFNSTDLWGTPAVADSTVYICGDSHVFAIDTATGKQRWTAGLGIINSIYSALVVNNTVYVPGGFYVSDYDALTGARTGGAQALTVIPNNYSTCPITIANNVLYMGYTIPGTGSSVCAIDLIAGQKKGDCFCGGDVFAHSPVVAGGKLYMAGNYGGLYTVNIASGTLQWKIPQVYMNDTATTFYAGSSFSTNKYAPYSSVACSGNTVYMGGNAFDTTAGASKWSYTGSYGIPALFNNTVFVSGAKGELYALDAGTGAKKWVFTTVNQDILTDKPCIVTPDGTVY